MRARPTSGAVRCTVTSRDGASLVVRPLRRGDTHALQAFDERLGDESRRRFTPHAYDEAKVRRMIERSEEGTDLAYVLLDGTEVVAYFFLWDVQDRFPVLGVGIADRLQGQGLGRRLVDILIEDARARGCDGIELTTTGDNDRAFALYRRCGFRYLGEVENVAGDGRVVIEQHMFLALKEGVRPPARRHAPPE